MPTQERIWRLFIILSYIILFFLYVSSARADWPMLGHNPARASSSQETITLPLETIFTIKAESKIISSPVVSGDTLIIGTQNKGLIVLSTLGEGEIWEFPALGRILSTPAVSNKRVYIPSLDRNIYAIDISSGSLVWTYNTGGNEMGSPLVHNDILYMGSGYPNKKVMAIKTADGKLLWKTELGGHVYSSPALYQNTLLIGANDGSLYALNKDTGEVLWSYQTKGKVEMASPAVSPDGSVLFAPGGLDGNAYCIDANSGTLLWKQGLLMPTPAPKAPLRPAPVRSGAVIPGPTEVLVSKAALLNNTAFFLASSKTQTLFAIDIRDGSILWSTSISPTSSPGFISNPSTIPGYLIVGTASGELLVINPEDGSILQKIKLDGPVLSSPAISNGMVYVTTEKGYIYCFGKPR